MPASPPTSPRFGVTRHVQSDAAIFSSQFNEAVDKFDNAALLTELTDETTRAEAAEAALSALISGDISTEQAARIAGDAAVHDARIAGDVWRVEHVVCLDEFSAPPQAAGNVIAFVPVPIVSGQTATLIGLTTRCLHHGSVPSVYAALTDNGHGDGHLSAVAGLGGVEPLQGRFVRTLVSGGPLALNDLDTVAVSLVTPGNTTGIAVAMEFGRAAP